MLNYSLKVCMALIQNRQLRNTILRVLVKLYMGLATPDFINVCQCLIFLDDPQGVANILEKLIKGEEDPVLMAYQIGFDLYESATQQFLQRIQSALRATAPIPIPDAKEPVSETKKEEAKETDMETEESETGEKEATPAPESDSAPVTPALPKVEELSESDKKIQDRITKLTGILGGNTTIDLHLQFLIRNNKSDILILKNTKVCILS